LPTTKTLRTWPSIGLRLLLFCLGALGVLVVSRSAWAEDQPKLAGVEVPAPKRTRFVSPVYPPEAKAQGQRGIVILSLVIGVDGKVASAEVVRSVPAFDEAALAAARLWEYEITRVDGKPVAVRLSVPITFALRLPEVTRGPGVPELREGLTPNRPAGVPDKDSATVVAALTVEPSGQVVAIDVEKGDWPWFESAAAALRTWAFVAGSVDSVTTYEVAVRFLPVHRNEAKVELRIERRATSASATAPAAEPAPAPEPSAPAPEPTAQPALPTAAAEPTPATETVRPPASPQPPPTLSPSAQAPSPAPGPAASPQPAAAVSPETAPLPLAPAPAASPGVSAVRDVTLGAGVPDLASGRRPVVPPLARMGDVSGTVEVRFTVDAGGVTSGIEVAGPEPLREAARQAVVSWAFRRTSAERLFLVASFEYRGWQASATVKRATE
jgi:TonB family protein